MTDMPIYMHFLYAFLATVGFAVFFNAPKSTLFSCGFVGGIGWALYYFLFINTNNNTISNFLAAFLVSALSEFFARKLKQPSIVFVIPGIIPLVPGLGMYKTMLYLLQGHYNMALSKGTDTLFVGGAISLGVLVVTSLAKTIRLHYQNL